MADGSVIFDARLDANDFQKDANKLGSIVKGLSVFEVIKRGMSMVAQSIDAAVSRYDTLNRFPRIMEQMGYGADTAEASMKKLSDSIQGLPTTLDEIVANTQQLAISTGSLEKGTDSAIALNNAFLASGASTEAASRGMTQYIQMLNSGKVDMQGWKTLQETMPYALQKTAEAFGFTGASARNDLYAALRDGEITFTQFNDKLIELNNGVSGFAEVAKTATGGIGTAMTNLKSRTVIGVTSIIEAIDRGFSQTRFKSIENIVNTAGTGIKNGLQSVAKVTEFTAKNFDILVPAVLGPVAAFKAYSILGTVTTSFKSMQNAVQAANTILMANKTLTGANLATQTMMSAALASETTAELVRTAAKKAGVTVDAAGNLTRASGAAVTTAETVAVLASSGAITAKTVLVGVLTGSIGLVTAAQWLWNAAMTANPVGAVVMVVIALVAAIVALIAILNQQTDAQKALSEEVEHSRKAHEDYKSSVEDMNDTHEESIKQSEIAASSAEKLAAKIEALGEKTNRTAAEQAYMEELTAQLNQLLPDQAWAYDSVSRAVVGTNGSLKDYLVTMKETVKAEANREKAIDLVKKQSEAEYELYKAELAVQEAIEAGSIIWINGTNAAGGYYAAYDTAGKKAMENAEAWGTTLGEVGVEIEEFSQYVSTQTETQNADLAEQDAALAELAAQYGVTTESIRADIDAQGISLDEWASAAEESAQRQQEALATYAEAATNMFDRISTESEQSVSDMIANLEHNQQAVAGWSNNLVLLAEKGVDQGLLQQLRDAGPESAATVAAMVNASDEELARLSEVFSSGADVATQALATSLGLPEVTNAGSQMVDELAGGVTANESLTEATVQMIASAKTALETNVSESNFSSIGQKIATEIVNGVKNSDMSGISTALTTAVQAGASSVNGALSSMGSQMQAQFTSMKSTSTDTITQMMTSVVSGITTRQGAAKSAATGVSSGIITTFTDMKTKSDSLVSQMMTSFVSGIQSKQGAAKSAAQGVATGVTNEFEAMKSKAPTVVEQMMTAVVTAIKNGTESAKSAASGVIDAIISAINTKGTDAYNAGKNIGQQMTNGMVAGLENGKGSVYAKADEIAKEAARRIRAALEIHSPSRVMEDIFQNVVLGMIVGMEDEENGLYRAVDALAGGVVERLNIIPEGMAAALNNKLRLAVSANQEVFAKIPAVATAGEGAINNSYVYNFHQTINSDKYMSPADNARAAEALLRKSKYQIK